MYYEDEWFLTKGIFWEMISIYKGERWRGYVFEDTIAIIGL